MLKRAIRKFVPKALEDPLRSAYHATTDLFDLLILRRIEMRLHGRGEMTPPRRLVGAIGGGGFEEVGREFLAHFISLGGLEPRERVLDVGCGSGRMAAPLTAYLTSGSYEGFDIVGDTVRWCQTRITPRFPRFRFQKSDVRSEVFNPRGSFLASEYRFPFEDASFDFVFLTSVFTHMLPEDMEHYLSETARVLKVGGRCLITFFLLNEESLALIASGKAALRFPFERNGFRTNSADHPELAIAYPEDRIRGLFDKFGLTLRSISGGSWCGRDSFASFQEIAVAVKNGAEPART